MLWDLLGWVIKGHAIFILLTGSLELPRKKSNYLATTLLVRIPVDTMIEPVLQPSQPKLQSYK